jgi:hypothetical protein
MTNEELRAENILLKQQLEELTSLTSSTEPDWKTLIGIYNEEANELINSARVKNVASLARKNNHQPERGTEWTKVDEIIFQGNEILLANKLEVHAVYESRERKRNAQLGLFPTLAELVSIIKNQSEEPEIKPNQTNLDANSLNHTQQNQRDKVPQR